MANIERRRKQRKLTLILAAAGVVLALGAAAAISIVLAGRNGKKDQKPVQTEAASAIPTENAESSQTQSIFSEYPSDTPSATDVHATYSAPPQTPDPDYTDTAADPEMPVRISDEQSSVLLVMDCVKRYSSAGDPFIQIDGKLAIGFVNNTDRSLFAAEFLTGELIIDSVTLMGVPAKFSADRGVLTVPFVNELAASEEVELFIEFSCMVEDGASFELPCFNYDTSYLLTAYIYSEAYLSFSGCRSDSSRSGAGVIYSINESSVHTVRVGVRF